MKYSRQRRQYKSLLSQLILGYWWSLLIYAALFCSVCKTTYWLSVTSEWNSNLLLGNHKPGIWTHIKLYIVRIKLLLMFISSCVSRVHRDSSCHSNIWQRFWHWTCLQCWEATVNQSVSSFIQHMGGVADVQSMLTALLMQTDSELFLCNLQGRIWWEHKIPFVLPKINEWKHS